MKALYLRTYLRQLKLQGFTWANAGNVKYFGRWQRSLGQSSSPLVDEIPWITFRAADYLIKHLRNECQVFEYGTGGSTLFFLKKNARVVSVEHDPKWFATVQEVINRKGLTRWTGHLIFPESGNLASHAETSNPAHYASRDVANVHFKTYAESIDQYPNGLSLIHI